jgi:hypothetical protein
MTGSNTLLDTGTVPIPVSDGGTGHATVTTAPAATSWAGWDSNSNLSANSHISGYATTATAAGTTVLTVASAQIQNFSGSTTQTVTLPVTSTLVLGQSFTVLNDSTGTVTVQSSGGNTVLAMTTGIDATFTCILTSGTSAASWNVTTAGGSGSGTVNSGTTGQIAYYASNGTAVSGETLVPIAAGGTNSATVTSAPAASAWAGWDANSNLSANNFIEGYATTATAAGTTTLTVSSVGQQFFTGSSSQAVKLPVTSTLVLGQSWNIVNNGSNVVTVQSSGTNSILALTANQSAIFTCILTSGTSAASWAYQLNSFSNAGVLPVANGGTGQSSLTNHGVLYGSNTLAIGQTAAGTTNQYLVATTSNPPVFVNGAPIYTANSTTSITGAVSTGYITTNASLATITLPTTFAVGTQIGVQGTTSGLWKLQAGTATTIKYLGQTTTSAGSLTATGQYDNCVIIGIVANTTWAVLSATTAGLTVA